MSSAANSTSSSSSKKRRVTEDYEVEDIARPPLPDLSHLTENMRNLIHEKYTVPPLKQPKMEHFVNKNTLYASLCDGCAAKNRKGGCLVDHVTQEIIFNIRLCTVCANANAKRGYSDFYGIYLHNLVQQAYEKERKTKEEGKDTSK